MTAVREPPHNGGMKVVGKQQTDAVHATKRRRGWAWIWMMMGLLAIGAALIGGGGGKEATPAAQVDSAPDDGSAEFDAGLRRGIVSKPADPNVTRNAPAIPPRLKTTMRETLRSR